jgi:hypothetical protein
MRCRRNEARWWVEVGGAEATLWARVEELEHGEDVRGGEAVGAEGAEGEGIVALGETDAGGVAQEVAMEVGGGGITEGALEQDLAGGGLEEVAATDDFGDGGEGVIDCAG